MVQAVACRAALYGFNSHPQLHGINPQLLRDNAFRHFVYAPEKSSDFLSIGQVS